MTTRRIFIAIILLKLLVIFVVALMILDAPDQYIVKVDSKFLLFILAGFVAQIVDGMMGMAYGVSCNTLLLHLGATPRMATAAVHTAQIFTTGVSGLSHLRFNNIDLGLFSRIVFTGVLGSAIGAYFISEQISSNVIKPFIAAYLLLLGLYILISGFQNKQQPVTKTKRTPLLAFFGGLFDAIGGGGWGPIVTTNLIYQGVNPRQTVGTVNTAEFFVTFVSTGIFLFFVGIESWSIILGLIIGGVLAAPFGAFLATKINRRLFLILIGIVISIISTLVLWNAIF